MNDIFFKRILTSEDDHDETHWRVEEKETFQPLYLRQPSTILKI